MDEIDLQPYAHLLGAELSTDNLEKVIEMLLEENLAERGCIWMPNRELVYLGDEGLRLRFPFSRSVIRNVLSRGRGFVSFEVGADKRLGRSASIAANNVRSCLCAAAHSPSGEILAIAYFDNQSDSSSFSERDLWFLNRVMEQFPGAVARSDATAPSA